MLIAYYNCISLMMKKSYVDRRKNQDLFCTFSLVSILSHMDCLMSARQDYHNINVDRTKGCQGAVVNKPVQGYSAQMVMFQTRGSMLKFILQSNRIRNQNTFRLVISIRFLVIFGSCFYFFCRLRTQRSR